MSNLVYYNGELLARDIMSVDMEDRGYQFADGVYEVIAIYQGRAFQLREHMERLVFSASEIDIETEAAPELIEAAQVYLDKAGYNDKDGKLYVQVTRGVAPRSHAYPDNMDPVVLMKAGPLNANPDHYFQEGVKIITLGDERWSRCYIKSIALLPNILVKKKAKQAGAYEGVMIRDGFVTEGASSNLFIVQDGVLVTPPATNYILNGITRRTVIEQLAPQLGLVVQEKSIPFSALLKADEVFLTGTTTEIMPVVKINDQVISPGAPGEITLQLYQEFSKLTKGPRR
ncbi:MAG: D-amino-acid transaminase [Bacillota bacterium]